MYSGNLSSVSKYVSCTYALFVAFVYKTAVLFVCISVYKMLVTIFDPREMTLWNCKITPGSMDTGSLWLSHLKPMGNTSFLTLCSGHLFGRCVWEGWGYVERRFVFKPKRLRCRYKVVQYCWCQIFKIHTRVSFLFFFDQVVENPACYVILK